MKIFERIFSAILCIGLSYGHLGFIQLAYAEGSKGSGPDGVRTPDLTVDEGVPAVKPAPGSPVKLDIKPIEAKAPPSQPAEVPPAVVPGGDKDDSGREGSRAEDHTDTRIPPPPAPELAAPPLPFDPGSCADLFKRYTKEQFCSATSVGASDPILKSELLARLKACVDYSYDNECQAIPYSEKLAYINELNSEKKGLFNRKKGRGIETYDPKVVVDRSYPQLTKLAEHKAKYFVGFDKVFYGNPSDKRFLGIFKGRNEKALAEDTIRECVGMASVIANDRSDTGLSTSEITNQCIDHAQTAARGFMGTTNYVASYAHGTAGDPNSCERLYQQGYELWDGPGEHQNIVDRERAENEADRSPAISLFGRNDINTKKTASGLASGVGRALDIVDRCMNAKKAKSGLGWLIALVGIAVAAILFLKGGKKKSSKKSKKKGGGKKKKKGGGPTPGPGPGPNPTPNPTPNPNPTPTPPSNGGGTPGATPGNGSQSSNGGATNGSSSGSGSQSSNNGGGNGSNSNSGSQNSQPGATPGASPGTGSSSSGDSRDSGDVTRNLGTGRTLAPKKP